jgi:hypothetical protein
MQNPDLNIGLQNQLLGIWDKTKQLARGLSSCDYPARRIEAEAAICDRELGAP